MTLPVTLAFAALALGVAFALLWSRWPAWTKALLVIATTVFYFQADEVLHTVWGWPSADALPPRFVLLAAVIDEPSPKRPGGLYLWVSAIEDGHPADQPRAYRLPYRKDLHVLLNEGLKKIREGVSQFGTSEPKPGRGGLSWLRPGGDEQVVKLRDLPSPQLPEK